MTGKKQFKAVFHLRMLQWVQPEQIFGELWCFVGKKKSKIMSCDKTKGFFVIFGLPLQFLTTQFGIFFVCCDSTDFFPFKTSTVCLFFVFSLIFTTNQKKKNQRTKQKNTKQNTTSTEGGSVVVSFVSSHIIYRLQDSQRHQQLSKSVDITWTPQVLIVFVCGHLFLFSNLFSRCCQQFQVSSFSPLFSLWLAWFVCLRMEHLGVEGQIKQNSPIFEPLKHSIHWVWQNCLLSEPNCVFNDEERQHFFVNCVGLILKIHSHDFRILYNTYFSVVILFFRFFCCVFFVTNSKPTEQSEEKQTNNINDKCITSTKKNKFKECERKPDCWWLVIVALHIFYFTQNWHNLCL